MTDKIDTGGPAFPCDLTMYDQEVVTAFQGATLRDYFAAKAMHAHIQAQWSRFYSLPEDESNPFDIFESKDVAELAYEQADAMLEARK